MIRLPWVCGLNKFIGFVKRGLEEISQRDYYQRNAEADFGGFYKR